MSAPYLNRGESIILTTHRMSVDAVEYDAILTTGRLILMDSRYTRFEPLTIPLPRIITVKGGKTPTGDPAIILILEEPGTHKEPETVSLVFLQEQGEQRKDERQAWVKKLIELAITAREQAVRTTAAPARKKTGMQPSVRRFEAPETPRPRIVVMEPVTPMPKPVEVVEDPDSPGFSMHDLPPPVPGEEEPDEVEADDDRDLPEGGDTESVQDKEPDEVMDTLTEQPVPEAVPEIVPVPVDNTLPEPAVVVPAGETVALPEQDETPLPIPAIPAASLASSISAALDALRPKPVPPEQEVTDTPSLPEPDQPVTTLPGESPEPEDIPVPEQPAETNPQEPPAGNVPEEETTPPEPVPVPEVIRVDDTPSVTAEHPSDPIPLPEVPTQERRRIPLLPVAILVLVAIGIVFGAILFASHTLPTDTGSQVVTPAPTVMQVSPPVSVPHEGVRVNVIYPYDYFGTVGNPERLHHVSGTGNQTFPVLMTSDIIQATIQKQDNSIESLTIELYNNSTLVSTKTVTAPMGEASILIDMKTGRSPGMTVDTPSADNSTLLGNGSLIYY